MPPPIEERPRRCRAGAEVMPDEDNNVGRLDGADQTLSQVITSEAVAHFDKVSCRYRDRLSRAELAFLGEHAHRVRERIGKPIRGTSDRTLLVISCPDETALRFLASRAGLWVNGAEIAIDFHIADTVHRDQLVGLLNGCFVQAWHGRHDLVLFDGTQKDTNPRRKRAGGVGAITAQLDARRRFAWYALSRDRPSKLNDDTRGVHLECRLQGAPACRRFGVGTVSGLLAFDHLAFWRRNLRLSVIDTERLGRWHLNKLSGRRRRHERVHRSGRYEYRVDRRVGGTLFHVLSAHRKQAARSVQRFIDRYGTGPYVQAIDATPVLFYVQGRIKVTSDADGIGIKPQVTPLSPPEVQVRSPVSLSQMTKARIRKWLTDEPRYNPEGLRQRLQALHGLDVDLAEIAAFRLDVLADLERRGILAERPDRPQPERYGADSWTPEGRRRRKRLK